MCLLLLALSLTLWYACLIYFSITCSIGEHPLLISWVFVEDLITVLLIIRLYWHYFCLSSCEDREIELKYYCLMQTIMLGTGWITLILPRLVNIFIYFSLIVQLCAIVLYYFLNSEFFAYVYLSFQSQRPLSSRNTA